MATALIILAPGAEEIEFVTIPDLLVRAGHTVVVAATAGLVVRGSRGLPLAADALLDEVQHQDFDVVYLPGGKGSAEVCRDDPRVQALAARQLAAGRWLAVICAAPIALVPQGLATGRRITSVPGVRAGLLAHCREWVDAPVVVDGRLVTSQSAGTAMHLGLALVRELDGSAAAQALATQLAIPAITSLTETGG